MHAPVRPPSPINQPSGRNEAHSINTTTSPDDARGLLRLPRPSSKIARGGQQPPVLLPHEQARPVHVRPAAPRPTGVPPSPNSLSKGTVALVVRGSGQGAGDDRSSRSATTRAGPILNRACSAAQVSDRRAPLMAGSVGRGARPMLPANKSCHGREKAADMWHADRLRSYPQESRAAETSTCNTLSQAAGFVSGARQQALKPAKPPRPPGPPPPHILLEQQRRREMVALQRAQQSASNPTTDGSDRGMEGGPVNPSSTGAAQYAQIHTTSRPHGNNNSSNSLLRGGDRSGGMYFMQAGASILGVNNSSSKLHASERARIGGLSPSSTGHSVAATSARGGASVATTGAAATVTTPASGPLSLASSEVSELSGDTTATSRHSSCEWQEFWDEEVEASYYFNCVTREAQWVRPDGF